MPWHYVFLGASRPLLASHPIFYSWNKLFKEDMKKFKQEKPVGDSFRKFYEEKESQMCGLRKLPSSGDTSLCRHKPRYARETRSRKGVFSPSSFLWHDPSPNLSGRALSSTLFCRLLRRRGRRLGFRREHCNDKLWKFDHSCVIKNIIGDLASGRVCVMTVELISGSIENTKSLRMKELFFRAS